MPFEPIIGETVEFTATIEPTAEAFKKRCVSNNREQHGVYAMFTTVGGRIAEARKKAGYRSQKDLADAFHVSPSAVGMWESNQRRIPIDLLLKLSKLSGVPCEFIINGEDTVNQYQKKTESESIRMECAMMTEYIQNHVTKQSIWSQVAEEAIEMAHAAMKIARNYSEDNPANITMEDAHDNFIEELYDFYTTLHVAGEGFAPKYYKLERWFTRLLEQNVESHEMNAPRSGDTTEEVER